MTPAVVGAKAILFDLDGTLVDTYELQEESYRRTFAELGLPFDAGRYSEAFGLRLGAAMAQLMGRPPTPNELEDIRTTKARNFAEVLRSGVRTLPLSAVLCALQGTTRTALVTSASRSSVSLLLAALGWEDLFDVVVVGDDVTKGKPHSEPYVEALRRLGLDGADCVAFEDSEVGARSAKGAGIAVVMVKPPSDPTHR